MRGALVAEEDEDAPEPVAGLEGAAKAAPVSQSEAMVKPYMSSRETPRRLAESENLIVSVDGLVTSSSPSSARTCVSVIAPAEQNAM